MCNSNYRLSLLKDLGLDENATGEQIQEVIRKRLAGEVGTREPKHPEYIEYGAEVEGFDTVGLCPDRYKGCDYNYKLNSNTGEDRLIDRETVKGWLERYEAVTAMGYVVPPMADDYTLDGKLKISRLAQFVGHCSIVEDLLQDDDNTAPIVWEGYELRDAYGKDALTLEEAAQKVHNTSADKLSDSEKLLLTQAMWAAAGIEAEEKAEKQNEGKPKGSSLH